MILRNPSHISGVHGGRDSNTLSPLLPGTPPRQAHRISPHSTRAMQQRVQQWKEAALDLTSKVLTSGQAASNMRLLLRRCLSSLNVPRNFLACFVSPLDACFISAQFLKRGLCPANAASRVVLVIACRGVSPFRALSCSPVSLPPRHGPLPALGYGIPPYSLPGSECRPSSQTKITPVFVWHCSAEVHISRIILRKSLPKQSPEKSSSPSPRQTGNGTYVCTYTLTCSWGGWEESVHPVGLLPIRAGWKCRDYAGYAGSLLPA